MKGPMKIIVVAVAVLVLVGGAFWGGIVYQKAKTSTAGAFGPGGITASGQRGPMANLTAEEQAQLQNMTDAERQAWLEKKFGATGAAGRAARGGTLDGEVIEVANDTITLKLASGSSQTVYTDKNTVTAYVEGAGPLAAGSKVMVIAPPASNGVTTATLVVVK